MHIYLRFFLLIVPRVWFLILFTFRTGNTESYKVNDLNVEADASGDDDEDDIDWEEG